MGRAASIIWSHIENKMKLVEGAQDDNIIKLLWKKVLNLACESKPEDPEQYFKQQQEFQRRIKT